MKTSGGPDYKNRSRISDDAEKITIFVDFLEKSYCRSIFLIKNHSCFHQAAGG